MDPSVIKKVTVIQPQEGTVPSVRRNSTITYHSRTFILAPRIAVKTTLTQWRLKSEKTPKQEVHDNPRHYRGNDFNGKTSFRRQFFDALIADSFQKTTCRGFLERHWFGRWVDQSPISSFAGTSGEVPAAIPAAPLMTGTTRQMSVGVV